MIVWFTPHPLLSVGVDVAVLVLPVICIRQAIVDCRICVFGLAARLSRKVCMAVGVSADDGPIVPRPVWLPPVDWSLPVTLPSFAVTWSEVPLVKALSTFCS